MHSQFLHSRRPGNARQCRYCRELEVTPFGPVEIDLGYPILKQSYDKPQAIRLSTGVQF